MAFWLDSSLFSPSYPFRCPFLESLFCSQHAYPLPGVVRATWVGLACNWLLPVAQVGGEIAKARMLSSPSRDLVPWAAMILDKTFQLVTQCCFGALGLGLLLAFRFDQATFRLALAGIDCFRCLPLVFGGCKDAV